MIECPVSESFYPLMTNATCNVHCQMASKWIRKEDKGNDQDGDLIRSDTFLERFNVTSALDDGQMEEKRKSFCFGRSVHCSFDHVLQGGRKTLSSSPSLVRTYFCVSQVVRNAKRRKGATASNPL